MSQVNRIIRDNPDLDDVDHALGRPYRPWDSYRDHYATSCPKQTAKMRESEWWDEGHANKDLYGDMTFFYVSDAGRAALERELSKPEYGRLYEVSHRDYGPSGFVMAQSRSAAKYAAYIEADLEDWSFMEWCKVVRVRLARSAKATQPVGER